MSNDCEPGDGEKLSGGSYRITVRGKTAKQKRDALFSKSRPFVRPFTKEDMGWLWAAYKMGSFKFREGMSQEEFHGTILQAISHLKNFIIEDDNKKFSSGRGPVALVSASWDGEKIEPVVAIFKWATKRNILRGFVGFFQWVKNSKDIGSCEIRMPSRESGVLRKMAEYGVLFPRHTEIVFRIKGKRKIK